MEMKYYILIFKLSSTGEQSTFAICGISLEERVFYYEFTVMRLGNGFCYGWIHLNSEYNYLNLE